MLFVKCSFLYVLLAVSSYLQMYFIYYFCCLVIWKIINIYRKASVKEGKVKIISSTSGFCKILYLLLPKNSC